MAALESKSSGPVEPAQGDKPNDDDEVSSTTPSFVANLLRNDGMTLLSQPGGGKTNEGDEGHCPLLPPSLEELDSLESGGDNGGKKEDTELSDKLVTTLVRAESPTEEKRSLQPPTTTELESMKTKEGEKGAVDTAMRPPGLKVRVLKQFVLPETLIELDLDPDNEESWQLWSEHFRNRLTDIGDKHAISFAFHFLKKIFNPLRECANCSKTRATSIPPTDNTLELFVTAKGLVGRIKVHCAWCDKSEVLTSCDDPDDIPTDTRVQISIEKTRGDFLKKITHQEVLHDLMELLHIAAMEHCLENKKRHTELAEFLLSNARRVCDQWCRLDFRELRLKKFLQFREEVLLITHTPNYMAFPHRSRDYMGMYEIMGNSFRENRGHIHTILQAIKDSLIDSPTRSHCMFWIGIAILHAENYYRFKEKYDPRSCMRIDEGEYWALHDRYIGLDAPVGVKKIPVVFVLYELPRFFHYIEFLEKTCGRRTKIFLTKKERFEMARAEKEAIKRGYSRPKRTGTIISPEKHLDFLVRQEELSRMTRNKKFVDAFNKRQLTDGSKKKKKGKKKSDKHSSASKTSESAEKKKPSKEEPKVDPSGSEVDPSGPKVDLSRSKVDPPETKPQNTANSEPQATKVKKSKADKVVTRSQADAMLKESQATKAETQAHEVLARKEASSVRAEAKESQTPEVLKPLVESSPRAPEVVAETKAPSLNEAEPKEPHRQAPQVAASTQAHLVEAEPNRPAVVAAAESPVEEAKSKVVATVQAALERAESSESQTTKVVPGTRAPFVEPGSETTEVVAKVDAMSEEAQALAVTARVESEGGVAEPPTVEAGEMQRTSRVAEAGATENGTESQATEVVKEAQIVSEAADKIQAAELVSEPNKSHAAKVVVEPLAPRIEPPAPGIETPAPGIERQPPGVETQPPGIEPLPPRIEPQAPGIKPPTPLVETEVTDLERLLISQAVNIISELQAEADLASELPSTDESSESQALDVTSEVQVKEEANFRISDLLEPREAVDMPETAVVRKPRMPADELEEVDLTKDKPLYEPEQEMLNVGDGQVKFTKVAKSYLEDRFREEHGAEPPAELMPTSSAPNGFNELLTAKILEGFLKGKIIPGEIVWIEDDTKKPNENGEEEFQVFFEDCTPPEIAAIADPDERMKAKFSLRKPTDGPTLPSILASKLGIPLPTQGVKITTGGGESSRLAETGIEGIPEEPVKLTKEALIKKVKAERAAKRAALSAAPDPNLEGGETALQKQVEPGAAKDSDDWKKPLDSLLKKCESSGDDLVSSVTKELIHMSCSGSKEAEDNIVKSHSAMTLLTRVAETLVDEGIHIKKKEKKEERRLLSDSEKETRLLLYEGTRNTVQALLQSGEAERFKEYIEHVYQEGKMDDVLISIEKKVCSRMLDKEPGEIEELLRVSATEYGQIISRELDKYTERKKRKPRVIKPEADPSFKNKINPKTYTFRGLPGVSSNLHPAAMLCTQLSTDVLRAQGYKVDTEDKMVTVIADRTGVIQHIVEGLDTQEEMEAFIENKFKVPKKNICDGTAGCMVLPGLNKALGGKSKSESVKVTGNPKKAKKRAKKLAKLAAPKPKKPAGQSVTLGGRTYSPEDLQALSEGTHPLMDSLPEIDESVDPFDVPALKKMHPWLRHVETSVMEGKNEDQCGQVLNKLMTPVPIEGLDPSIPRQVIAYPSNATTPAWNSSDPVKEHNANVSLANAFMNKMESYSQGKKPPDEPEAKPETKPAEDKPVVPPAPTSTSLVPTRPTADQEAFNFLSEENVGLLAKVTELLRHEAVDAMELMEDRDTQLLAQLNAKIESAEDERLEKLVKKKQSKTSAEGEDEESRVPHRQMRMLDAMGIPYRLDSIKVVGEETDKGTVLCKLTLLPFDKSRKNTTIAELTKKVQEDSPKEASPKEDSPKEPRQFKGQRKKAKQKQTASKPNPSPLLSSNHPPTLDTIEDLKSSSSTSLEDSLEKDADSAPRPPHSQSSSVSDTADTTSMVTQPDSDSNPTTERQLSQLSTASSGASNCEEAVKVTECNSASRGRVTARDRFKTCAGCSQEIKDRIQLCAGCKKVAYCNPACQKANWKIHKKTCAYAVKKRTG